MASSAEAKLELFLAWLQVNGVELRGCEIKYCDSTKGFGVFSSTDGPSDVLSKASASSPEAMRRGEMKASRLMTLTGRLRVLLVVPLNLAITPMRVLEDPLYGQECRAMFEEGEVDDRLLIILFLTVERLRKNSPWKPYLDMLPTTFGSPLWFTDEEFTELKGTALHQATNLQRKQLRCLYEDKVKALVEKFLSLEGVTERKIDFEDFLWANSIFWTRALNIPFPRSYVFPEKESEESFSNDGATASSTHNRSSGKLSEATDQKESSEVTEAVPTPGQGETVWVEGLVPGIDFCNHDLKAVATWEVDGTGSATGVPNSMYLLSALQGPLENGKEIRISYGNKGNEELLYLYGFVIDKNPDDYLMVHYPAEAMQMSQSSDAKFQLLEFQNAEMRCLLPRSLLEKGFFPSTASTNKGNDTNGEDRVPNFSWSGHRKTPSYVNKLIFPENFLTALRTAAIQEEQLSEITHLLEEVFESKDDRQPSEAEVRAAVWEVCGDSGALQLLVDLLQTKLMNLEEGTGTVESDTEQLKNVHASKNPDEHTVLENGLRGPENGSVTISRNRWSAIVYRRGQKELARLFLKEAEHALQLSLSEANY